MNTGILQSALTCPHCGFVRLETMPTEARQFFYKCTQCQTVLRPHMQAAGHA